jgi:hypothetical protein
VKRTFIISGIQNDNFIFEKIDRKLFSLEDLEKHPGLGWERVSRLPIQTNNRAQVPVVDSSFRDIFRIYYSDRNEENKSLPFFVDVLKSDPTQVVRRSDGPILRLGARGSFDWAGVMPTEIIEKDGVKYLYYVGWSQRVDVPYHNSLGLAISEDGENFSKVSEGPVFSTSRLEPGYIGTMSIVQKDERMLGYYLSCRNWIESSHGLEPLYDIKLCESQNGIDWTPTGISCIPLDENSREGGISQACVRKLKSGKYEMHFSVRGAIDYREDASNSYRIKSALSDDGIVWERNPRCALPVAKSGWDSLMTAYPYVVSYENSDYLFYNGNGFGSTGIGYAKRKRIIE